MLRQVNSFKSLFLCIISAVFLILAFPRTDIWLLSWGALVPFLLAIEGKKNITVFLLGLFTGVLFFAGTLYWFIHVTMLGMSLLIVYLSFYFVFFALGCRYLSHKSVLEKLLLIPSFWVGLEFLRGHLLTGFGWASLGHSQYKVLPIIQIADLTGFYGISFLIVMVNVLLKEFIALSRSGIKASLKSLRVPLAVTFFLLALSLGYGYNRLGAPSPAESAKMAVIQANVPQELKWERRSWPGIMKKYLSLTKEASVLKPDVILWPETSFPGFIWESPELFEDLKSFTAGLRIPLLLGVVIETDDAYLNSAVLISKEGEVVKQYDKIHLVPFGEYIPLRNIFPFLSTVVPIGDFTAGKEYALFPLSDGKHAFSVLICFEDTIPEVARGFVRKGANILVNITNDAWFEDTKAPYIHLAAALFRSVENRRSLVRVANTGVSCFINEKGKILSYIEDKAKRKSYVTGLVSLPVSINTQTTFYTNYGDVFTYLCFGGILGCIIGPKRRKR